MTNEELREHNKDRKICQICIATKRPIEEVLDEWVNKLKVGPWTVLTISNDTVENPTMNGKPMTEPFKYYCALAMYGNIQIEIVQPVYGECFADGFLDRAGEGLQHFKEQISNEKFPGMVKQLEDAGYEQTFQGWVKEDHFCNFDTESSLGFALELGNFADITLSPDMYYTYPRED